MNFRRVFINLSLLSAILFLGCQNYSDNQEKNNYLKLTQEDSTDIIQNVLKHKRLDSLLNFAFKDQTLKIVTNNVIKHSFTLTMNDKPVEFTQTDSSSNELSVWNKPAFYAKITVLRRDAAGVRLVIFFESIGLFGEYKIQKTRSNLWEITNVHFAHT